jgi:hypothetical protein
MRNLFLALVLVNLGFAAWHAWWGTPRAAPAQRGPSKGAEASQITLVKELGASAEKGAEPETAGGGDVLAGGAAAGDASIPAGARTSPGAPGPTDAPTSAGALRPPGAPASADALIPANSPPPNDTAGAAPKQATEAAPKQATEARPKQAAEAPPKQAADAAPKQAAHTEPKQAAITAKQAAVTPRQAGGGPAGVTDGGERCVSVGPFLDLAQATTASAKLRASGYEPSQRAGEGDVWVGYWVYLDAIPSRDEANRILTVLHDNGVADAYGIQGDDGRIISLGVFNEIARAGRLRDEVRALGFEPKVVDRTRRQDVYFIDLLLSPSRQVDFEALQTTGRITRLEQRPCPGAAA